MRSIDRVEEMSTVTGATDLLVRARVADLTELRQLLVEHIWLIAGIQRVETTLAVETVRAPRFSTGLLEHGPATRTALPAASKTNALFHSTDCRGHSMTTHLDVRRYAAFSDDPAGGNPAGVVLDASHLTEQQMQQVAAEVGYSETAFVTGPIQGAGTIPIRYFAPEGEVDFCGHATIATAVAIGQLAGAGAYTLQSKVGPIETTARLEGDRAVGTLRSPDVDCLPLDEELLAHLLAGLRWSAHDLDPDLPPAIGFGGNRHPVLVAGDLERLATLAYDFDALQRLCRAHDWVTVQLVVATGGGTWRARDPFPWGGVVEDPATGAAAAAFAGYLRAHGRAVTGDTFAITQGVEMGRPSHIQVELLERAALISGSAAPIEHDESPNRSR